MYNFKNKNLEKQWCIHPGFMTNLEFQRLEFLGDKILGSEVAKILYVNLEITEGQMTNAMSHLVNQDIMAEIGAFLIPHIKYRHILSNRIISSCLESWIAAVYLDGGDITNIINILWQPYINDDIYLQNYKNLLQEYATKHKLSLIYEFKNTNAFHVVLKVGHKYFEAIGKSKKAASIKAAALAYESFLKLNGNVI